MQILEFYTIFAPKNIFPDLLGEALYTHTSYTHIIVCATILRRLLSLRLEIHAPRVGLIPGDDTAHFAGRYSPVGRRCGVSRLCAVSGPTVIYYRNPCQRSAGSGSTRLAGGWL